MADSCFVGREICINQVVGEVKGKVVGRGLETERGCRSGDQRRRV